MKIGIMQPYFFPYIGYWQLLNQVDQYVIYDDVNFIKGGWINRNRILNHGKIQFYNLMMQGASSNKLINEIGIETDTRIIAKNLRMIENCYSKAPYYNQTYELIRDILTDPDKNLAKFLECSIKKISEHIGINTKLIISSQIEKDNSLRGQEKVLEICRKLGASEYYNAIGGRELYDFESFSRQGIRLKFLHTKDIEYRQFEEKFVPNLSIIDVLMFNPLNRVRDFLDEFELIQENESMRSDHMCKDSIKGDNI